MMTNKIAIMQPYIFPYIGYMNLVNASDKFVFYDDVNFIKKGWINRNNILLMRKPYRFSIPLKKQSQNILIKDTEVYNLEIFADNFLNQLASSYTNSSFKNVALDYVREVLNSKNNSISELAISSVKLFFEYVGVEKQFLVSSKEFSSTKSSERSERLIKITKCLGSKNYINAIGGNSLYNKKEFAAKGINLNFVKPLILPYIQCNVAQGEFNPSMSIIDLMMNLSQYEILTHLDSYELI